MAVPAALQNSTPGELRGTCQRGEPVTKKQTTHIEVGSNLDNDAVMISPVIGEGIEAHRKVHVRGYDMTVWQSDEEPRIRDLDLAERLGFERLREVRTLIKRLEKDGEITDLYMRCTMQRISKPNGGFEERTVNEYWLTEEQALLVAMHSKTERAKALRKEMVRVFMLARRGLLPQQAPTPTVTIGDVTRVVAGCVGEAMTQLITNLPGLVRVMVHEVVNENGAIGDVRAEQEIKSALRTIARMLVGASSREDFMAQRQRLDLALRCHVDHPQGRAWKWLSLSTLARAQAWLDDQRRDAARVYVQRKASSQMTLFVLGVQRSKLAS